MSAKYKIVKIGYKRIIKKGLIETKETMAKNLEYEEAQRFLAKFKGTVAGSDKILITEDGKSHYLEIISQSKLWGGKEKYTL